MGLAKTLLRIFIDSTVACALIVFLPGLPPYHDFESWTVSTPLKFEGPLSPGDYALNNGEKLFEGEVLGPEALEVSPIDPDVFYTTIKGGAIMKVYDNGRKMEPVAKLGGKCAGYWDVDKCGRPLGIRFDKNGDMIASDSYLGIFKINFNSGETTNLVPKGKVIEDKPSMLFNSVAPSKDGKIYYTISSTEYSLDNSLGEMLGAPSGRLLVFDPETNESTVLKEELHFANGLVLSAAEDYLIMSECLQYRLLKYWIKGPKAGTMEVFLDGLPGTPDNLSFSPDGNIFVSLVSVRMPGKFNPNDLLYEHWWMRKIILRLMHLVKMPLDLLSTYSDLPIIQQMSYYIMSFESILPFIAPYSIILEVDWQGKILESWHSNQAEFSLFSEAKVINGYMYLSSPYNDYIGRVKMHPHYLNEPFMSVG